MEALDLCITQFVLVEGLKGNIPADVPVLSALSALIITGFPHSIDASSADGHIHIYHVHKHAADGTMMVASGAINP